MFKTLTVAALAAATLAGPRSTVRPLAGMHDFTAPIPELTRFSERTPTAAILKIGRG